VRTKIKNCQSALLKLVSKDKFLPVTSSTATVDKFNNQIIFLKLNSEEFFAGLRIAKPVTFLGLIRSEMSVQAKPVSRELYFFTVFDRETRDGERRFDTIVKSPFK
jgi:hypothetical protein